MLDNGFEAETEIKTEMDHHLRALAKWDSTSANAPRDNVLLPLAIIARCRR